MSLKTWPSNIIVLSKFARISCSETSTRSKRELYALSTVVKTLYKGPIASSNFGCCLTKFEPAATTKLPALFSNIRSLINSSIFLVGWRLSGTYLEEGYLVVTCLFRPSFDEQSLSQAWFFFGGVFLIHEFISSFNFSSFSVTATIPLKSSLYRKSLHPETMFHVRPSSHVQRIWKFLQKRLLFPEYFCSYRYVLTNKAT